MHGEAVTNVKIYVIKKKVETLLSGKACEDLGIIRFQTNGLGWEDSEAKNEETDEIGRLNLKDKYRQKILQRFPEAFRGIGKLRDYQVKFYIDQTVSPVIAPHRPVPFHLREKFNQSIKKMEEADIIEECVDPPE